MSADVEHQVDYGSAPLGLDGKPLRDDHPVPCKRCERGEAWMACGLCDDCYVDANDRADLLRRLQRRRENSALEYRTAERAKVQTDQRCVVAMNAYIRDDNAVGDFCRRYPL